MRSSRIGHVLTSLSKSTVEDVSQAASKARDVLRDRMKSLQVPGGLSKRSIASATSTPATSGAPTSQPEPNSSDSAAPAAAAAADAQEQAPSALATQSNSPDDFGPGPADINALQERTGAAGAAGTVPVSIGGTPSTVDAVQTGGKGDTPVSNGTLSHIGRIGASIIAPARKASEVIANIKRSFSSGSAGGGATGAVASGVSGVAAGVLSSTLVSLYFFGDYVAEVRITHMSQNCRGLPVCTATTSACQSSAFGGHLRSACVHLNWHVDMSPRFEML